ncbi:MAG TPA: PhnD/SsuA/transferrin family substrate-binding protein [Ignavibacteriaceae bacterium]|nr:PhnD/SsuA/transferrin family substrate-binding protein [Ignavibacteriaceae bacterium]
MKSILISYSFIFLMAWGFAQNTIDLKNDNQKDITLIFSLNTFHNVKVEDAQAVAEILANHINKSYQDDYKSNVKTLSGAAEIERIVKDNFDCIILSTEEYIALKNKMPLEAFATNYSEGNIGYKFYLIVNKDSEINDISQLKNETINILASKDQKAAYLWLDKLLKDKKLPSQKKFFKSIVTDYKATNVLLPVFFNKAKACIVTESSLNLLSELNPAIKKNIRILNTSEYFLLGVCCLNQKRKGSKFYNRLKEMIPTLHQDEYGSQLLKLFNADKLVPFKEQYLTNYLDLMKN